MELYVLVTERTADSEPEIIRNVRNYERHSNYHGHVRAYSNIGQAHSAKTTLSKMGVKVAIIKLDLANGIEVE